MPDVITGIDLGGIRIKAAAIDGSCNILYRHYQPTDDADDTAWKNAVASAVREIQSKTGSKTEIIGISAPGLPNTGNTAIAFMPGRLQGLENFDRTRFAAELWLTSVKKLAIGPASLTNILSPEMIILGGGISAAGKDLMAPLEKYMAEYEWRTGGNKAEITIARFGDLAGAAGTACFARETAESQTYNKKKRYESPICLWQTKL